MRVQRGRRVSVLYAINEKNCITVSKLCCCCFFSFISVWYPTRVEESTVIFLLQINSKWKQTSLSLSFSACSSFPLSHLPCPFQVLISHSKSKQAMLYSTRLPENVIKSQSLLNPFVELVSLKFPSSYICVWLNLIPAYPPIIFVTWVSAGPRNL